MLGVETLTEEQLAAADFDGSGTVIRRMHCSFFALHSESVHKAARFRLLSAKAGETEQLTHS